MSQPSDPISSAENGPNGDAERDANGRFLPGWRGGPGRPRSERAKRRSEVFASAWSDEDLRQLGETIKRLAISGDLVAARLALDHLCGRPVAADVREEIDELSDEVDRLLNEGAEP